MSGFDAFSDRVLELRRAFDQTFAAPPPSRREAVEDFLAIRVAGDSCALRVREISHLSARRKIVPVRSRRTELLGLAGIRGILVPVYSLAHLMGYPASTELPRWLVTCGAGMEAAFAFEEFDRYLRVPAARVSRVAGAETPKRHVDELVQDGALVRAVIDLSSVTRSVTNSALREGQS